VQDLFSEDWETMREEVTKLARLYALRADFTSLPVHKEQAVRESPQLVEQNQGVLNLIDKIGYATEGIYRIAQANKGVTHIPKTASLRQVNAPLPIDQIALYQFSSEGLDYMPAVAKALGIKKTDGQFTRISINGIASGLTDKQTRAAMELIFLRYPTATQTLSVQIGTDYYIFWR
jgi:hypothetical protein